MPNTQKNNSSTTDQPKHTKPGRPNLEPTAIRQLTTLLGSEKAVAKQLGLSHSHINAILNNKAPCAQPYELAARHLLSKHYKHEAQPSHLFITCPRQHEESFLALAKGLEAKCIKLSL